MVIKFISEDFTSFKSVKIYAYLDVYINLDNFLNHQIGLSLIHA